MAFHNPWMAVALAGIVLPWVIETVVSLLNLRRLGEPAPPPLHDLYDQTEYRRSQDYARDRTRLELIESTTRLGAMLAFWACGGFPWLEWLVAGFSSRPVFGGLAGLSLVYAASALLLLPFSLIQTFILEARYGFNRTSPLTFASDALKNLAVTAAIGLPVAATLLWLFAEFSHAWLWAWAVVTGVVVTTSFLAPRLLLPLFFKFSPLEAGPLREAIERLANRCRFPCADVEVVDGSRRSSKANAFFSGFGKTRRIALFDTLVHNFETPEIEAVLAHEIGHARRHIVRMMVLLTLQIGGFFLLLDLSLRQPDLHAAFGLEQRASLWLKMVLFGLVMKLPQLAAFALVAMVSRRHEFEADAFASAAVNSPAPLASALRKLARNHLTQLSPHPWLVALTYSHPPLAARLAALRAPREPARSG